MTSKKIFEYLHTDNLDIHSYQTNKFYRGMAHTLPLDIDL